MKEGITELKEENNMLFHSWNTWCSDAKFHIEYNKVAFGMKLANIGKKIEKAINKIGIHKDTHSNTFIYPLVIKEYLQFLDDL